MPSGFSPSSYGLGDMPGLNKYQSSNSFGGFSGGGFDGGFGGFGSFGPFGGQAQESSDRGSYASPKSSPSPRDTGRKGVVERTFSSKPDYSGGYQTPVEG